MFCNKCGKKIEEGEQLCKSCKNSITTENSEENNEIKGNRKSNKKLVIIVAIIGVILIGVVIFLVLRSRNNVNMPVNSNINSNQSQANGKEQKVINEKSTAENDMDLGLSFTKVDNKNANLTEEQKNIVEYFDNDYLDATNYEFLQRYPQVFSGTQVFTSGKVEKIISSDNDNYEILFWIGDSKGKYDYWQSRGNENYNFKGGYEKYLSKNENNFVVIKGKQSDTRLMQGDFISIRGRYENISDYTIDGKSYNVPVINAHRTLIGEYNSPEHDIESLDSKFIRKVAKTIFGDITIREPVEEEAFIYSNTFIQNPWYICELDNQSNSKFGKYAFSRTIGKGKIIDIRNSDYPFKGDDKSISREIEFAPDFEHFYLFIYDRDLNFLTVEYFDKDLKKLWSREFEDTKTATYDFTKNNVYLIANNSLYIINTSNGKDTYSPKFVGEKLGVRKLADSIIMFSTTQYDAIIKTDLKGDMIWKTNVDSDVSGVMSPQIVDNNLIVNIVTQNEGNKFIIVDLNNGKITLNAKSFD